MIMAKHCELRTKSQCRIYSQGEKMRFRSMRFAYFRCLISPSCVEIAK